MRNCPEESANVLLISGSQDKLSYWNFTLAKTLSTMSIQWNSDLMNIIIEVIWPSGTCIHRRTGSSVIDVITDGLSPVWHQAITWRTNAELLSIRKKKKVKKYTLENVCKIRPFCSILNDLSLVIPCGNMIELGQHWIRWWLIAWWGAKPSPHLKQCRLIISNKVQWRSWSEDNSQEFSHQSLKLAWHYL